MSSELVLEENQMNLLKLDMEANRGSKIRTLLDFCPWNACPKLSAGYAALSGVIQRS
jgi:hypothetical protein